MVAKSLSQLKLNIWASFLIPGYPGNTTFRAISGLGFSDSTTDSFKKLKLLTLEKLYRSILASLMWEFDHAGLPNHLRNFLVFIRGSQLYYSELLQCQPG